MVKRNIMKLVSEWPRVELSTLAVHLIHLGNLENPMNSMKRQNDRIPKEELPRLLGAQYATGDQRRKNYRKNEGWSQSKNNTQLWM